MVGGTTQVQQEISASLEITFHVLIVFYSTDVEQQEAGAIGRQYHPIDRDVDTQHISKWSVRSELVTITTTRTVM